MAEWFDAAGLIGRFVAADNTTMDAKPKQKRRWFQFSLRTLLIGVTLLAVTCGYVASQAKIIKERSNWLSNPQFFWMPRLDGTVGCRVPWIRRLFGDTECMLMIADDAVSDSDLDACRTAFPELDVQRDKDVPAAGIHFRNGRMNIIMYSSRERDQSSEAPAPTWQPSLNQTLLKYEPLPNSRH